MLDATSVWLKIPQSHLGLVYQEIYTPRKSIERLLFSWSYDQEKHNLHKCVILSQTKNIEKVLI